MKDLILTWIGGKEFCKSPGLRVFLNSIKSCGFDGDVVIMTDDMPEDFRKLVTESYGYRIVDIEVGKLAVIVMDRFLHFWEFLVENCSDYRYVLQVDSKDVVFQINPSEYMRTSMLEFDGVDPADKVVFIPEGMIHLVSAWNTMDQFKFQKHLLPNAREDWQNWPVYNAGTIVGDARVLKDFDMLVWQATCRTIFLKSGEFGNFDCFTDQAALNYLYNAHLHKDTSRYTALKMQDQTFCLTGESAFKKYLKKHPYEKDGIIFSSNTDKPYCMVHQWERTEFTEMILEKHGEKS